MPSLRRLVGAGRLFRADGADLESLLSPPPVFQREGRLKERAERPGNPTRPTGRPTIKSRWQASRGYLPNLQATRSALCVTCKTRLHIGHFCSHKPASPRRNKVQPAVDSQQNGEGCRAHAWDRTLQPTMASIDTGCHASPVHAHAYIARAHKPAPARTDGRTDGRTHTHAYLQNTWPHGATTGSYRRSVQRAHS